MAPDTQNSKRQFRLSQFFALIFVCSLVCWVAHLVGPLRFATWGGAILAILLIGVVGLAAVVAVGVGVGVAVECIAWVIVSAIELLTGKRRKPEPTADSPTSTEDHAVQQ